MLGGAVTTNQLPFTVSYVDISQSLFTLTSISENDGVTNDATAVSMVTAPATDSSRQLKFLSIYQLDTVPTTVTIRINNNGTFRIVWRGTLQVGDNLIYTDDVFVVMDSAGSLRSNFSFGDPLQVTHGGTGTSTTFTQGSVVFAGASGIYGQDNSNFFWDIANKRLGILTAAPTQPFSVAEKFLINSSGLIPKYNNINTSGWGIPAIYGTGRSTAQVAAVASVAAYTVGATDGSFLVSANVNVTVSTNHNFTVTITYTDETNTSRTLTFGFTQLSGATLLTAITNATGVGPYESLAYHIRCKASTTITIATTGTFTTVTYNVEGNIAQVA